MAPILPPGTTLWFDPRITPQHLDFVLVALSEATLQWLRDLADRADPEWVQAHPEIRTLHDVVIKQFRVYHGRAYLVSNDGQLELGDNEILGVLVHAERQ